MITVKNLTFTYRGGARPAVRDLNFHIAEGEIFGLLGPSGAGKSTTQKILTGLLKEYQGQVSVFGRDLSDWGPDYYERTGVSFELPNHYLKLTGIENLAYFSSLYSGPTQSPQELLEMVGLQDDGHLLVSQYSKGMKNRLTVARSLLHNPQLLFLDEPTAGLDPVNARRIRKLIKEQQHLGKTIFLTTHDMHVADVLCDRVAFIIDGRIALIDTPRALKLTHGRPQVRIEYLPNGGDVLAMREFQMQGLGDNDEFWQLLRQNPLQTIHSQEATLEDIFIRVTGRSLT